MFGRTWPLGRVPNFSSRTRKQLATAAAITAISGGVYLTARAKQCKKPVELARTHAELTSSRRILPLWLVHLMTGSFAECVQVLVLYPLDTLKVNCQHAGQGSLRTLASLWRTYPGLNFLGYLYNGSGTMAVASIIIGAVYYVSFKQGTILFEGIFARAPCLASSKVVSTKLQGDKAQLGKGRDDVSQDGKETAETNSSSIADARADVCAAFLASFCTAFIEGPVDCVRARIQTGVVKENMLQYIIRGGGVLAAWPFFLTHLLRSVPYDVTELVTYSGTTKLVDMHGLHGPFPHEVRDALIGGLAGAAAVIASAPSDCIRTRIVTMSPAVTESMASPASTGRLWWAACRHIMRTQGIAGLFVGTLPRLFERVPSTMMYWVAAEACTRSLEPYTKQNERNASTVKA